MSTYVLQIKRRDTWDTLKESQSEIAHEDLLQAEVPYRCGGYYESDMYKTVRIVELKVGSPEKVLYETTDQSREAHAREQLDAVRYSIIQAATERIYKRIGRGITKYMPGDCPCSESWDVREYVGFQFRAETEYLTDETIAAIDRFVSEMISRSNSINRGDYNAYNTPEKIRARARHAEMVNHNLAVHQYEVQRHAGRTTAQQKEHERTRDCPW